MNVYDDHGWGRVITSICTAAARLYIKTPLGGTTRYSQVTRPYVAQLSWSILHSLAGLSSAPDRRDPYDSTRRQLVAISYSNVASGVERARVLCKRV